MLLQQLGSLYVGVPDKKYKKCDCSLIGLYKTPNSWMQLTQAPVQQSLVKKGPWAVPITLCSDKGVGGYS